MSNAQLAAHYYAEFQAHKIVVDNYLATPDGVSTALQEIQALKRSLTDATAFLPAYDQRRYQDQIKEWERSIAARGVGLGNVAKRPRFAFKKKSGSAGAAKLDVGRPALEADGQVESTASTLASAADSGAMSDPTSAQVTLRSRTNRRIDLDQVMASSAAFTPQRTGFSLVLEDVNGCLIDLRRRDAASDDAASRLTALYGANIRDSVLLVPEDMAGSVMLDRMQRVVIVAGCQQFRIHSSARSMLLLYIPSNPIIEHSSALRFGPYPLSLRNGKATTVSSRHDYVQDFGWIKPGPSPNFEVVDADAAERVGQRIREMAGLQEEEGWPARLTEMLDELL
ncbi:hypothetical protein NliqN6_1575 [Naganishia liquefaciens]|uniref:C-CAP/cofactor C-like domain-containing protein n=1 Tax=Naganishia liquefaciens TaxID=104408 RepID=A0A8H3TQS3_9TREE|nr:hypothetical protein NliqN6_1575 [Naganishia liquefaciens]